MAESGIRHGRAGRHAEGDRRLAAARDRQGLCAARGASGFQPVANTPEEYAAYIKADIPRWGKVTASIRID
jgi:hypothetical protein